MSTLKTTGKINLTIVNDPEYLSVLCSKIVWRKNKVISYQYVKSQEQSIITETFIEINNTLPLGYRQYHKRPWGRTWREIILVGRKVFDVMVG